METTRLEVRTLSDRILEIVREKIVSGAFGLNDPIRQDALAKEFQVSKIPLREALARLEQEGLVVSQPNRGFFVRPLSYAEAEEVFALRLQIEPDAAAHACLKATDQERERAVEALAQFDAEARAQQPTVGMLNRRFHMALIGPAGRPLTESIIARLHVMADRYVRKHLEPTRRPARAEQEHHEILKAWLARNDGVVRALIAQHLQHTCDDLLHELTDAGSQ